MRPPTSYPDNNMIRQEEHEIDGQGTSVLVRWSFLSWFRLQLKGAVLLPLAWLGFAIIQICVVAVLSSLSPFDGEREFTISSILLTCISITLFFALLLFAFLPFQYGFLMLVRGRENLCTITPKQVKDVARRFPISVSWERVIFIRRWSGDLLIITFEDGVLVPREAFRTPMEAEDFIVAARQFHRRARTSGRNV